MKMYAIQTPLSDIKDWLVMLLICIIYLVVTITLQDTKS